jgi:hypothetical protein
LGGLKYLNYFKRIRDVKICIRNKFFPPPFVLFLDPGSGKGKTLIQDVYLGSTIATYN